MSKKAALARAACRFTVWPAARVVEWQTRTFEGRMPKGLRVQVPPRAPLSTNYVRSPANCPNRRRCRIKPKYVQVSRIVGTYESKTESAARYQLVRQKSTCPK